MSEVYATILKGDSIGIETDYRDALPINMSAVLRKMFGAAGYMLQEPGLTQYGTAVGIDRRGIWNERHGEHYRVSGNQLISVDSGGAASVIGNIPGLDTVSLPYSFNTQGIVAGGRFWLYDLANGLVEVVDPDLGDPVDSVWIDGYYLFTDLSTIYHTDITDESSISPLKFATSEFSPDPTLGVGKTSNNKLIAFNRYSVEYFKNSASANFAWSRLPNRAIKIGIVGTHCKIEMGENWYIMGGRKNENVSIHMLSGASSKNISSREIDKIISKYTEDELSVSVMETRTVDNYSYIIVHLPNQTLLYNETLALVVGSKDAWSLITTGVAKGQQWRGKFGIFEPRLGKWVYGDKSDGRLGILDNESATQYGDIAEWVLNTPFMYFNSLSINEFEVEIIPGHTKNIDATVFVSLTYDGSTHGLESMGDYGEPSSFTNRFILYRLGHVDQWVGIKMRGASRSRMAFGRIKMDVS